MDFDHVMMPLRCYEPDGYEIVILDQGTAIELYHGRSDFYSIALSPATSRRVILWILTWWVCRCWCGLVPWWQERRLRRHYDKKRKERRNGYPKIS